MCESSYLEEEEAIIYDKPFQISHTHQHHKTAYNAVKFLTFSLPDKYNKNNKINRINW